MCESIQMIQKIFTFAEAVFGFSSSCKSFGGFRSYLIHCLNFLNREHEFLTAGT